MHSFKVQGHIRCTVVGAVVSEDKCSTLCALVAFIRNYIRRHAIETERAVATMSPPPDLR
jgi:hypothetical protein